MIPPPVKYIGCCMVFSKVIDSVQFWWWWRCWCKLSFFIKIPFLCILLLIHSCFFIQFYAIFNNVCDVCEKGLRSLSQIDIYIIYIYNIYIYTHIYGLFYVSFVKFKIASRSDYCINVGRNWKPGKIVDCVLNDSVIYKYNF
jgi:hypothetical protein